MKTPTHVHCGPGLAFLLYIVVAPANLDARGCRPGLMPNASINDCSNCHLNPRGGGIRTPFGQDVLPLVTFGGCTPFWSPALAMADSDGDGRSNGEELQDPDGLWQPNDPNPGSAALVTNPGVDDEPLSAEILVSPLALDFATVSVGDSSTLSVEIVSNGTATLDVTGVFLQSGTSAAFSITSKAGNASVAPGNTRTVEITCSPADPGAHAGTLKIASSDIDDSVVSVSLAGTGVTAPMINVVPSGALDFSVVAVGQTSTLGVTINNMGTAPLTLAPANLTAATSDAFVIVTRPACCVAPGESTLLEVSYSPADTGPHGGTLVLVHDAVNNQGPVDIPLTGTTPGATETPFLRGDINSDKRVDIGDPIFAVSYLFLGGPAPTCPDAVDANDDGRQDIGDAITLLNFQFLGTLPPPPPYPNCGPDLTDDSLSPCQDLSCTVDEP